MFAANQVSTYFSPIMVFLHIRYFVCEYFGISLKNWILYSKTYKIKKKCYFMVDIFVLFFRSLALFMDSMSLLWYKTMIFKMDITSEMYSKEIWTVIRIFHNLHTDVFGSETSEIFFFELQIGPNIFWLTGIFLTLAKGCSRWFWYIIVPG